MMNTGLGKSIEESYRKELIANLYKKDYIEKFFKNNEDYIRGCIIEKNLLDSNIIKIDDKDTHDFSEKYHSMALIKNEPINRQVDGEIYGQVDKPQLINQTKILI
jgi:hypothetical protein